jgi:hypothetical protein
MDMTGAHPQAVQEARGPHGCPDTVRVAFERSGWSVAHLADDLSESVTFAFLATRRSRAQGASATMLVFGYEGSREVRLADLWRLVAELNTIRADDAALYLGDGVSLSAQAAETAALLHLSVLRHAN